MALSATLTGEVCVCKMRTDRALDSVTEQALKSGEWRMGERAREGVRVRVRVRVRIRVT